MGLLSQGTPLDWPDVKRHAEHIRTHGIEQLIHMYNRSKDKRGDKLLWGDEVEMMVVEINDKDQNAKLSLRQAEILDNLANAEANGELNDSNVSFHPEYGRYMLECTPARPFTGDFEQLLQVEQNMAKRRAIARQHMSESEVPISLTSYPRLGVGQFCDPYEKPEGKASRSFFLPDKIINPHVRFPTLTANIRQRRGSKVAINVPIYVDEKTPQPFVDPTIPWDRNIYPEDANAREGAALTNHIYMDSMGFGMGCCCLQITFQATDITEARNLYDQLAPLSPIFLALTAASPIYRGYLADQDARWNVIAGAVDDRTEIEREIKPEDPGYQGHNSSQRIPKSRYDSIDCYISHTSEEMANDKQFYNDQTLVVNNKVKDRLLEAGFDELLATHFAHLFIRDPIVIFQELLEDQDDSRDSDHFENIQSTNWQTMRFKPPPPGSEGSIGWRVEFRSMEIQLTDFENAAFSIFIVLMTRVILSYNLNFYLPISKVDENMKLAHKRDGVNKVKFWFRTNIFDHGVECQYKQMCIDEILNGSGDDFIGLVPLVRKYLQSINIDLDTLCELDRYLKLVSLRASGDLVTTASWIRQFVRSHPDYKQDSVVSEKINYDLIKACQRITEGQGWNNEFKSLLGLGG